MSNAGSLCPHGRRTGSYRRGDALGAFITVPGDRDRGRVPASSGRLPLSGMRVAVKDNIDVAGWVTAAGSAALPDHEARSDAPVVQLLKGAGCVMAARTRMDEFAMTTYGLGMRNPFDAALSVGGSSGGSALAVSAGGFCAALGTDTGGSVRIPASYCGVVGFKPSFGRVPVAGVVPLSRSLDHVGVLACSAAAAAGVFRAIAQGVGAGDRTTPEVVPTAWDRLRVGVPCDTYLQAATIQVRAAFDRVIARIRQQGAQTVEVDLPSVERLLNIHYPIALKEAVRYHETTFPDLSRHGAEVLDVLTRARAYSEEEYLVAQEARASLTIDVDRLLRDVDVLALPTTPTTAPRRHARPIRLGTGAEVDAVSGSIWYTALFNDTGLPAISLPCGTEDTLPAGVQLVAQHGADECLLEVAQHLERLLRTS